MLMKIKEVKVLSSNKPKMFLFFNIVYVTSEYLTVASDNCLESALKHEGGHLLYRKVAGAYTVLLLILSYLCFYLLPMVVCGVIFPVVYLLYCWFLRRGEFFADRYSLTYTTSEGLREMLLIEHKQQDNWLSYCFYALRWHPAYYKRLENLGL